MFFDSSYPLEGLNESLSFLIRVWVTSHHIYTTDITCLSKDRFGLFLCLLNDLMIEDHK